MMRKALLSTICTIALLLVSTTGFAAEKVDNVFIAGFDAGYQLGSGWFGENYDAGITERVFFGYGITEYFSMELYVSPYVTTSPSGDDVANQDSASILGAGVLGRLYPRKVYREADFKVVQPYLGLGLGIFNITYQYKSGMAPGTNDSDSVMPFLADLRLGIDFFVTEYLSIGPSIGYGMFLTVLSESDTVDADVSDNFGGGVIDGSVGLKFQW